MAIVDAAVKTWQAEKYVKKDSVRINFSTERAELLSKIKEVLVMLARMRDPAYSDMVSLKLAYIKECTGGLQDAISILSDLITAQANNGVDLSFIILRAAVLIKVLFLVLTAYTTCFLLYVSPCSHKLTRLLYMITLYRDSHSFFHRMCKY